jgi:hypothetical protein
MININILYFISGLVVGLTWSHPAWTILKKLLDWRKND